MPQSLANLLVHLIFSTKHREKVLTPKEIRDATHAYLAGILKNLSCPAVTIGGMPDHVHILCNLSRTCTVAKIVEEVKKNSSKWLKMQDPSLRTFQWQSGYGAFSVSQSNVDRVRQYIDNQEEHHRVMTFQDEYRQLLQRHGVECDEQYVWD